MADADGRQAMAACDASADRLEVGDDHVQAVRVEAADVGVESEKIQAAGRLENIAAVRASGKTSAPPERRKVRTHPCPRADSDPAAHDHPHLVAVGLQITDDFA